ncbi:MAG: MBL fold metallo-hydrolase [Polyangiaceae bacterium]
MSRFARLSSLSVAALSLVTLAALGALGTASCAASVADPHAASVAPPTPTKARVGVYTSDAAGFDTKTVWFDTGREIVVFDAQFTERHAKEALAAIRAESASPIRYLVITHPNPDKFNGALVFRRAGATVVASRATAAAIPGVHAYKRAFFVETAKMFAPSDYPEEATVDLTFDGELTLDTDAGHITLRELCHSGVSSTQTVGFFSEANALAVGDLVHHKAHAWLEGGIVNGRPTPDLTAWQLALDELLAFEGATVYGGRGEAAPVAEAVASQKAYLVVADKLVRDYVRELGDSARAELDGPRAAEHYAALAKRFAAAFPERQLGYLVQYGVYGLARAALGD